MVLGRRTRSFGESFLLGDRDIEHERSLLDEREQEQVIENLYDLDATLMRRGKALFALGCTAAAFALPWTLWGFARGAYSVHVLIQLVLMYVTAMLANAALCFKIDWNSENFMANFQTEHTGPVQAAVLLLHISLPILGYLALIDKKHAGIVLRAALTIWWLLPLLLSALGAYLRSSRVSFSGNIGELQNLRYKFKYS